VSGDATQLARQAEMDPGTRAGVTSEKPAEIKRLKRAKRPNCGGAADQADQGTAAPRSAARRIAWHVLEYAWEMQDRADSQVVQPRPGSPAS
jgi:hypothetical protein